MKNLLFGLFAVALLAACAEEQEPVGPVVDIDAGKAIAEESCSGCHGMDGRGETGDIPNLAASRPTTWWKLCTPIKTAGGTTPHYRTWLRA